MKSAFISWVRNLPYREHCGQVLAIALVAGVAPACSKSADDAADINASGDWAGETAEGIVALRIRDGVVTDLLLGWKNPPEECSGVNASRYWSETEGAINGAELSIEAQDSVLHTTLTGTFTRNELTGSFSVGGGCVEEDIRFRARRVTPLDVDGRWEGALVNGEPLGFEVASGRIHAVDLSFDVCFEEGGTHIGNSVSGLDASFSIIANRFDAHFTMGPVPHSIAGTFEDRQARGVLRMRNLFCEVEMPWVAAPEGEFDAGFLEGLSPSSSDDGTGGTGLASSRDSGVAGESGAGPDEVTLGGSAQGGSGEDLPDATCDDGTKNGDESDLDCGDPWDDCPRCGNGMDCQLDSSCESGSCHSGSCAPPPLAVEVVTHYDHTCARFDDGRVKCWGSNSWGQLGTGDRDDRGSDDGFGAWLPVVDLGGAAAEGIAVGIMHSCALLDDGGVKCWGFNNDGQLGVGHSEAVDSVEQFGAALERVDLGTGRRALSIAAGGDVSCALLDDGDVKCWGANNYGQLGVGDKESRGDDPGEMGDALPAVELGAPAVSLSVGGGHVCALLEDGALTCWGGDFEGELGIVEETELGDPPLAVVLGSDRIPVGVGTGFNHTCALLGTGGLLCWGGNDTGQLGHGNLDSRGREVDPLDDDLVLDLGTGRSAILVVAGGGEYMSHTCALLNDGDVKCWGYNASGQLGIGDTENRGDNPDEMGDALPIIELGSGRTVRSVSAGAFHTCALLDDGGIKCWGENSAGQLGVGDEENRGDDPGEMGDALPAARLW